MTNKVKELFQKLDDNIFLNDKRLAKALKNAKENNKFRKVNYGKYCVLICGDHKGNEINLKFLRELKSELIFNGINCNLGEDYIKKAGKVRQKEITEAYLNDADIIIFINGSGPGTFDESNLIRTTKDLKKKTIAFFKYKDFNELEQIPEKQDYRTEFKYPVPYKELIELKAKIKFGVKHVILYFLNKEIDEKSLKR